MDECKREELSLNEADFLRSIDEILTKKLTKGNATDQWVRDIRLPLKHSTNDILRACDRLVRDVPMMLKDITEWRHLQSLKCNSIQVSDPLLN